MQEKKPWRCTVKHVRIYSNLLQLNSEFDYEIHSDLLILKS